MSCLISCSDPIVKCQTINCENYLQCPPEVNFMLVRYEEKYELGNWCAVTEVRFDYTRFIFINNFALRCFKFRELTVLFSAKKGTMIFF